MRVPATRKTTTGRNTRILRGAQGDRRMARSLSVAASESNVASESDRRPESDGRPDSNDVSRRAVGAVSAAAIIGSIALAGCASQDPAMPDPPAQTAPVVVGADGGDDQQLVLAEVYAGALESRGREADVVDVPADERIDAVRTGHVSMAFGCTGELLGILAPDTARQLAEEYEADDDPGKATSAEWRDRIYGAMSEALPGEVMATDPSNAQGCGAETELAGQPGSDDAADSSGGSGDAGGGSRDDSAPEDAGRPQPGVGAGGAGSLGPGGSGGNGDGAGSGVADVGADDIADLTSGNPGAALPQHIVPFYLKPTLTRHERVNALNRVAGSLTTDEVAELTEDTRRTREPRAVAEEWLTTSRFATG